MADTARYLRFTRDAALVVAAALPAAGAANATASLNLGAVEPGPLVEEFDALVELPAVPALVDTKKITLTLSDSADGVTFAAIPELAPLVITGAGGVGAAAASRRWPLPQTVRRYLRLEQAVEAAGGNSTAVSGTLSLLF